MVQPTPTPASPLSGKAVRPQSDSDIRRCLLCERRAGSVCAGMDEASLAVLARSSRKIQLPPGTTIVEEGDQAGAFFNITAGTVKLFKSLPDGRRQITGFADAGQFLGLGNTDVYPFGAETVNAVQLCRFQRQQLETLLIDLPRFERNLLASVTERLTEAQEQMLLLGRKTAREKVASFLLGRLAIGCQADLSALPEAEPLASVPMTRVDIADYLGLTIETVSRTISALRREKIIASTESHSIRILAPATLRHIATGQPQA